MLADFWTGLSYLGTAGYWYGFLIAVCHGAHLGML